MFSVVNGLQQPQQRCVTSDLEGCARVIIVEDKHKNVVQCVQRKSAQRDCSQRERMCREIDYLTSLPLIIVNVQQWAIVVRFKRRINQSCAHDSVRHFFLLPVGNFNFSVSRNVNCNTEILYNLYNFLTIDF